MSTPTRASDVGFSPQVYARMAGFLYLIVIVRGYPCSRRDSCHVRSACFWRWEEPRT
jgi:hypothetical protein